MTVLLTTINSKYIHQNLAVRILYELNRSYPGLSVKEFSLKDSETEIIDFCSQFNLVAFSCYIWNITQTLEVAKKIKQVNPHCRILLGGPEVSHEWDEIIALPEIDFLILDEGEIPFAAFLKSYPVLDRVPGLVWKRNGTVIENFAPGIFDLQQFQYINPYKSIPEEELQHKIAYIEASRGCPNCCEFCLAGLQNRVRYFPTEAIEANLLYLMEHGRVIKFLDRTFNNHPAFAISVFRFILQHYKPGNIFQFEIKADILQPDIIGFIQTNVPKGIFRFEIGIQTLNSKSNREIKRKQNFENTKAFIAQIADRIEIHLDLIVGLPHDSMADIKYSFEEVFKLFAPELQLGFLKFLKGTPIRKNYREHAYQFDPSPPYQIIESKYLSKQEIEEIALAEHALDIYWNKKRATNTLKYVTATYSIFDFLRGLGMYREKQPNQGLTGIYIALHEYSHQCFRGDSILTGLIAMDYYLQHKVKPGIRFLPEISKAEKNEIIDSLKLNHHKYRYVMHRVHFAVGKMLNHGIAEPSSDLLIIEFTGVDQPRVILWKERKMKR